MFLISYLSKRFGLELSPLGVIVFGFTFWCYSLVSVVYIMGTFSALANIAIVLFFYITVFIIILLGGILIDSLRNLRKIQRIKFDNFVFVMFLGIQLTLLFSIALSHSLFIEFDAINVYLPTAKSILETGTLNYNFYHSTYEPVTSPALPIIYAFMMKMFGTGIGLSIAIRLFGFLTIIMTSIVIYMLVEEVWKDKVIAKVAVVCFFSLPVIYSVSSNYIMYQDVLFTFLLFSCLFLLMKILRTQSRVYLLLLGTSFSLMALLKDVAYLILPWMLAALAWAGLVSFDGKRKALYSIFLAFMSYFTYWFLFLWDLLHFPSTSLTGILVRQLPIFLSWALTSLFFALYRSNAKICLLSKRMLLLVLPSSIVLVYLLVNFLSSGSISDNFFPANGLYQQANSLMAQANPALTHKFPTNVGQVFDWIPLFVGLNGGGLFIPLLVLILIQISYSFLKKSIRSQEILLISFLFLMLTTWSFLFNNSYSGSELRRLYYFAPLIAILVAGGVRKISSSFGEQNSLIAFLSYSSFSSLYFWLIEIGIPSTTVNSLHDKMNSLGFATTGAVLPFIAFLFVCSLIGLRSFKWRKISDSVLKFFMIPFLILLMLTPTFQFSWSTQSNIQGEINYVYPGWENNLYEVINYMNSVKNNWTVVTTYAHPLAFFASHPIIEITAWYGVAELLKLNATNDNLYNNLLRNNVRYLLLPKPNNNYYQYYKGLAGFFPVLNTEYINKTPNVILVRNFMNYNLYILVSKYEIQTAYTYLVPLSSLVAFNDSNVVLNSSSGAKISARDNRTLIIGADSLSFWSTAKSNQADTITLSNASDSTLTVYVNGSGNMVLLHKFSKAEDWSSFAYLQFEIYGADTMKPIVLTFHSSPWRDYYSYQLYDNFKGWKVVQIPLTSFSINGDPSWSNITYIEILIGNRSATYYLRPMRLVGHVLGVSANLPAMSCGSTQCHLVLSADAPNMGFIRLTSNTSTLYYSIVGGVNNLIVPAQVLTKGSRMEIYFYTLNASIRLYYIGVLNNTFING